MSRMTTDENRTRDARDSSVADPSVPSTDEGKSVLRDALSRVGQWRASRSRTAQERQDAGRLARQRRDVEVAAQRDTAARVAAANRRTSRGTRDVERDEDIAPVPRRMLWTGIWAERTIGALPLIAPLVMSGWFTWDAMSHEPINVPGWLAFVAALALEGGIAALVRLLVRTLLEGDSTVAIRFTLVVYLVIISGVIFWHADHQARQQGIDGGAMSEWLWVPAAAAAAFSLLGVRIYTHAARFKHRVALRDAGRIDKQAPKFALMSWVLCPVETPLALRHAVKYRLESPVEAVEDRRLRVASGRPRVWPVPVLPEQRDTELVVPLPRPVPRPALTGRPVVALPRVPSSVPPQDRTGQDAGVPRDGGTAEQDITQNQADVLKLGGHVLVVTRAFPHWRTDLPPVRGIRDAIHAHRQQQDGGSFSSKSVAGDVQRALRTLREHPHLLDLIPVD